MKRPADGRIINVLEVSGLSAPRHLSGPSRPGHLAESAFKILSKSSDSKSSFLRIAADDQWSNVLQLAVHFPLLGADVWSRRGIVTEVPSKWRLAAKSECGRKKWREGQARGVATPLLLSVMSSFFVTTISPMVFLLHLLQAASEDTVVSLG